MSRFRSASSAENARPRWADSHNECEQVDLRRFLLRRSSMCLRSSATAYLSGILFSVGFYITTFSALTPRLASSSSKLFGRASTATSFHIYLLFLFVFELDLATLLRLDLGLTGLPLTWREDLRAFGIGYKEARRVPPPFTTGVTPVEVKVISSDPEICDETNGVFPYICVTRNAPCGIVIGRN